MIKFGILILTLVTIYSCNSSTENNNKQTETPIQKEKRSDSLTKIVAQLDTEETIENIEISEAFAKAVECFPNDSASLYRFYFKWNSTTDQEKIDKQIKRLEKLTSKESVERYRSIENNLKPLMTRIVNSKTISQPQSDSLVTLYSDYDYFSGESLFSRLLTNNENYDLVWESFRIMVKESKTDTCFISGLIQLDKNIRTNAELGQAMQDFTVQAVRNNPIGFLEMYEQRNVEQRTDFANYIAIWDSPDKELIEKYSEISENSTNENYKKLATELIGKFKD
ncbi:hypothetical protein ACFQ1M_10025 [Sungkyunkwania multivorans]|uniref:Lipoprotein n=1 Tax=Sungkyunkwania multivorans TaxID=1173618 RepID=A0ABW3CXM6_9FLAO